jgi:hypothetical protein
MFLDKQSQVKLNSYENQLRTMSALSKLFSESAKPFLDYRVVENIFCNIFGAENISRNDCSADASIKKTGIGIKTYLYKQNYSFEKIAEFNKHSFNISNLDTQEKIYEIARLRNERLDTTKRIYEFDNLLYHCVTRDESKIIIYECPMNFIDSNSISKIKVTSDNIFQFNDKNDEYKFYLSKSVLLKKFKATNVLLNFEVKILNDPFKFLEEFINSLSIQKTVEQSKLNQYIYLPLYSASHNKKIVAEKSGLNQWNGGGRNRDYDEIYIPIPSIIHSRFPNFLPPRYEPFKLILPNKKELSAKICQDGSKALMSNPNSALGQWLLRDVLNLKIGELLTYDKLEDIGLDSVILYKIDDTTFDIDFAKINSYEDWLEQF